MGINKKTSLQKAFWKFLVWLLTGLGISVAVPFYILLLMANMGLVTFADNSEQQTKALIPILTVTPDVKEVHLPPGTKYLHLDKSYEFIDTNMNDKEQQQAMSFARTGQMELGGKTQFVFVNREDEYIILQYYIGSQYMNPWLNEHLPSPEVLIIGVIVLNCLIVCVFLTTYFAKMLRRELSPLFQATRKIKERNLDFQIQQSQITEFENVLQSFDSMRNSLKDSLEKQWRAEQTQKEQIASLAHDLKTPLTVIQGNIDLLDETNLDEEQQLYTQYIMDSSEQMKQYIRILIEISKATIGYELQKLKIDFSVFWDNMLSKAEVICKDKKIELVSKQKDISKTIIVDSMLLERAVMNLILNASDYAPKNTPLYLETNITNGYLNISVIDCGCGFSDEALKHAHERFYMGEKSRGSKIHFGMGLYIVDTIVKQHRGVLLIENSSETCGAKVTIKIPC